MGETRVDLLHLLEDLRDAYSGSLEETILTELVANSLDSRAIEIGFWPDPSSATLTVADDGSGMSRSELRRYHDIAATTKARGEGIGFAGVGVKLALLLCEEVVTESRRGKSHFATSWRLASRHRAPWRWVEPVGRVGTQGTGVSLRLQNPLSPLLDAGFLERTVRLHFQPLFDAFFADLLRRFYPDDVRFSISGRPLSRLSVTSERAPLALKLRRQRKPSAVGFLHRAPQPLPDELRGLGVATLGKVIKRGWDWLGLTPPDGDRISGLVEVPALAACLTLDKGDFVRSGPRGATYLAYRKALQEVATAQLAEWSDAGAGTVQERRARPVERDLRHVLEELARDFPLLASLVEASPGGQRKLKVGAPARPDGAMAERPVPPVSDLDESRAATALPTVAAPVDARTFRRGAHYGLRVQFEKRPDDRAMARLVESTVWINEEHPAYRRARASRSEGYHMALAVAMTLAPLAAPPEAAPDFLNAFLRSWGEAVERAKRRRSAAR